MITIELTFIEQYQIHPLCKDLPFFAQYMMKIHIKCFIRAKKKQTIMSEHEYRCATTHFRIRIYGIILYSRTIFYMAITVVTPFICLLPGEFTIGSMTRCGSFHFTPEQGQGWNFLFWSGTDPSSGPSTVQYEYFISVTVCGIVALPPIIIYEIIYLHIITPSLSL